MFSVIIPVYKVEKTIDRCVKSVLNQLYDDFEVILVDDGSPDKCPELCDLYGMKDSRVRVIHKPNGGLSDARNVGIDNSKGTYCVFLDSDDFIDKSMLMIIAREIKKYGRCAMPDVVTFNGKEISESNAVSSIGNVKKNGIFCIPQYLNSVKNDSFLRIEAWMYSYKRDFLNSNFLRFKKGILHEDLEFTPRAISKAHNILTVKHCFYYYIRRAESISRNKDFSPNAKSIYGICKSHEVFFKDERNSYIKAFFMDYLVGSYLSAFVEGNLIQDSCYIDKRFVFTYSRSTNNMLKCVLFLLSPKLYVTLHSIIKSKQK